MLPQIEQLESAMKANPALYQNAGGSATSFSQEQVWDSASVNQHRALQGFASSRQKASLAHDRKINEGARLYADVLTGVTDPIFIREAMSPRNPVLVQHLMERYPGLYGDTTGRTLGLVETMSVSDYQALTVDVLDRMYYGTYNTYPIVNEVLAKVHNLRDFRTVKRYILDGLVSPLTYRDPAEMAQQSALYGPVPQGGATLATASTAAVTYAPLLGQSMTSVNWAAIVNDDLGIFQDLAVRLAIEGNRGVSKFITSLYMDAAGPNVNLYKAGYTNLITTTYGASSNNPVLGVQGLSDALKVLAAMKDSSGQPIMITGRLKLWFGPSLLVTANNLMNQLSVFLTNEGGGAGNAQPAQFLNVNNWLVQNMDLVMDPYIPIVCTDATKKFTSWGLTVDPNSQNRPSLEVGYLNGFRTPQIYSKIPNTQRIGGGVDAMMGDFYTMDQEMKIISVIGGTQIDGRSTVASNGSAS